MLTKYFKFIKKLYEKEDSGLALALFRIVYGLVVFCEVWQIFYFRHLIFDIVPYKIESVFIITPILILWLVSLFLITIGFLTKYSTITNYIISVLILGFSFSMGEGAGHEYHIDTELLTVGFVLMFMPISNRLSIDRLILKLKYSSTKIEYTPQEKISSINYIILTLAAGLIYFDSIFFKASSPMWLNGLGIWLPASLPWATWLDLSFILNQEYLVKFLGYLTLVFQATYIFFVWFKKIKTWFLLIGISLHIGIFFAFPIPWFALAMVALYIGVIPSSFYSAIYTKFFKREKKPSLRFYFDENCPLCNRLRIIIQYFDNGRNIEFKSVQKQAHNNELLKEIKIEKLLENVYSINKNNKIFTGIDTYVEVLNRVWIFKPIGILLYIPFVKALGSKIYSYIAQHRITYGCSEDSCSIPVIANSFIEKDENKIKILQNLSLKELKIFFVGIFILFFSLIQLIIIQKAPLSQHIYEKIGLNEGIRGFLYSTAESTQDLLYPITGFESHGVFMDNHFRNYTSIYNIYYLDKDNKEIGLPLHRENGLVDWMNTSRQWRYWTFSTINYNNINFNNVQKILRFWAYKSNIKLDNSNFKLKKKDISVKYSWEKDLLKNNLQAPWQDIATIGWKNGEFYSKFIVNNIDFKEEKLPIFINSISGISGYEQQFRWSDGKKSEIVFKTNLPNKFKLTIEGIPCGPSINGYMRIILGDTIKEVILKEGYSTYSLEFNNINSNKLIFEYENPKSPEELGVGSDKRKLSFAFYKIKFEEM